jgi:hypothetical protein
MTASVLLSSLISSVGPCPSDKKKKKLEFEGCLSNFRLLLLLSLLLFQFSGHPTSYGFFFPYLACYDFRYGGTITNQIKRLGASCDWTRERFTLDEQLSRKAVFLLAEVEQ